MKLRIFRALLSGEMGTPVNQLTVPARRGHPAWDAEMNLLIFLTPLSGLPNTAGRVLFQTFLAASRVARIRTGSRMSRRIILWSTGSR